MSIGIADVMAWLKSLDVLDAETKWTMARLNAGETKRIGVYQRPSYGGAEIAIGGEQATKTRVKHVQILVHWSKNARDTEEAAQALYDALAFNKLAQIDGAASVMTDLPMVEPADVGASDEGIFERVIWLDIYYQEG